MHINHDSDNWIPPELRDVEQRLRDCRPTLSPLELDETKLRVLRSARRPSRFTMKKGSLMKSRAALVAILALGVFMSGTGATLAVSGFARSGSASSAQYPKEEHATPPKHAVQGEQESGNNGVAGTEASHELGPEETSVGPVETEAVRQQATTGSGSLPFTGFLAIPVLVIGVGLLGAGALLRLRARRDDAA